MRAVHFKSSLLVTYVALTLLLFTSTTWAAVDKEDPTALKIEEESLGKLASLASRLIEGTPIPINPQLSDENDGDETRLKERENKNFAEVVLQQKDDCMDSKAGRSQGEVASSDKINEKDAGHNAVEEKTINQQTTSTKNHTEPTENHLTPKEPGAPPNVQGGAEKVQGGAKRSSDGELSERGGDKSVEDREPKAPGEDFPDDTADISSNEIPSYDAYKSSILSKQKELRRNMKNSTHISNTTVSSYQKAGAERKTGKPKLGKPKTGKPKIGKVAKGSTANGGNKTKLAVRRGTLVEKEDGKFDDHRTVLLFTQFLI